MLLPIKKLRKDGKKTNMKKKCAVYTKHVFAERFVYRLTYCVITDSSRLNKYGIMVTSEKFRCSELLTKKSPTTTQILSEEVILNSESFAGVMKKLKMLSDNLVFPSDLKDILAETI